MVKRYECPSCGAMNSLWPAYRGRGKYYRCENCEKNFSSRQLDKAWNISPSKSTISVTPIKR